MPLPYANVTEVNDMYAKFVRERISQLRIQNGVSEYQMSYDLGHSRGYINNISSGKALPSMNEFFLICEYFKITPIEFFDIGIKNPEAVENIINGVKKLDENDINLVCEIIKRLGEK